MKSGFMFCAIALASAFLVAKVSSATVTWRESILLNFKKSVGTDPGSLIFDSHGNLYGSASSGGSHNKGAVFELIAPPPGKKGWVEKILYNFTGGAANQYPSSGLIFDASGNLYGMTEGDGATDAGGVFMLSPPAGGTTSPWTKTELYAFGAPTGGQHPTGGLTFDKSGNLYGVTFGGGFENQGTVFELVKPAKGSTSWSLKTLYTFDEGAGSYGPMSGVVIDKSGNLYGTAGGDATPGFVYELQRPAKGQKTWTEIVIGADGCWGLTFDTAGNLYGQGCVQGSNDYVFKLSPPSAAVPFWYQQTLYTFESSDGVTRADRLVFDPSGNLYGTSGFGGLSSLGDVYMLTPPSFGQTWTKTELYSFQGPKADGSIPYRGVIFDPAGNLYGTTYQGGKSNLGTIFELTP